MAADDPTTNADAIARNSACPIDDCGCDISALGMCISHYERLRRFGDPRAGRPLLGIVAKCAIEECEKPTRTRSSRYCNVHYHRMWRKGSPDKTTAKPVIEHSGGYIQEWTPDHPLKSSGRRNYVYQHRRVYYDHYGEGPHQCHWCGKPLTWKIMHIDHLDNNKKNNLIENLKASCAICNQARGLEKLKVKMRARGHLITYNGETKCLAEWAELIRISVQSLRWRIVNGWSVERALTEPRGKFGPRSVTRPQ